MDLQETANVIAAGETALGIELGSTRIKAVLTDKNCRTIASGSFEWENRLEDGIWTYPLALAWEGIQSCYSQLAGDVEARYHTGIESIGAIGVSAMMHGYLPFDKSRQLLAPFRTWRNNITSQAAAELTDVLMFNIPQRWSVAHIYQAMLNGEEHVKDIAFLTTLAGYVHWKLSGEKVLGIGDASGMFPIDEKTGSYDEEKLALFDQLELAQRYPWKLKDILPTVKRAGEAAGTLTEEGARLLDVSGKLREGSLMAPPEGDAGTGMVSTNSVRKRTGNISVGTSAFSMNVLDAPLKAVHQDIDVVTTPDGAPVAMVHTNNCSSDINAWTGLFREFADLLGVTATSDQIYAKLFEQALKADPDAGGLLNYSCLSGENITRVEKGRPMFVRSPKSRMNLANFMLTQLYGAFAPLKIGMDILIREEQVKTDVMVAQGGLFRTPVVGQQVLANTLGIPITVMETAGEGGPWGMAVLAVYAKYRPEGQSLSDFLDQAVFSDAKTTTLQPQADGAKGCGTFIERYRKGLEAEIAAGDALKD